MSYAHLPNVLADRPHPRVLRLTLNRPEQLNALAPDMHRALTEVWREIDADPSVSVVIITGAGRGFSAGGDLDLVTEMTQDFETRIRVWKEAREMVYNMIGCSKPIISAINGPAVGAGLVLALMADITIAGHSAKLIDGHTSSASRPATTLRSSGRCSAGWPRRSTTCLLAPNSLVRRPSGLGWSPSWSTMPTCSSVRGASLRT